MAKRYPVDLRLAREKAPSVCTGGSVHAVEQGGHMPENVVVDCGWGRLLFAHTFGSAPALAAALCEEQPERRDIAMYVHDPHVLLAEAPQSLFLDPSHTYRLWLAHYQPPRLRPRGVVIRRLKTRGDASAINRLYQVRRMVPTDPAFIWRQRGSRVLTYVVAEDKDSGEIIGVATGVDHRHAFEDPENGASLWALAVDPQSTRPGVGEALTRYLAEHYLARGRSYLDLSVMHDNAQAIALYRKLGFQRISTFSVKHKNAFNESLFIGPDVDDQLNPYARIIVDEARSRGIRVDVLDAEDGYFRLTFGGRSVVCRESLTELTSAIAMGRCQDKQVTSRLLRRAGLRVPEQQVAGDPEADRGFLEAHGSVVVKPNLGEQGKGITVNVQDPEHLVRAIERARPFGDRVLLESFHAGEDLRLVVIGYEVVAAALRRPAQVVGTGRHSIAELIEKQSRRRAAATGGESRIPMDEETERCVAKAGWRLEEVLPYGESLKVRSTANLHTGGTIHDVTDHVHPKLIEVAVEAARAINIPVVGMDLLIEAVDRPDYVIIEANERPGLANHEPQPTAQRFIDLLFPLTAS